MAAFSADLILLEFKDVVEEIREGTYVDDIHLCGQSKQQTVDYKEKAIAMFREDGFSLYNWHSNVPALEASDCTDGMASKYAKERYGNKLHVVE